MGDFREHVDRILSTATDRFGEEVIFFPKLGGRSKVRAIFENEHQTVDPDTEQVLSTNQPALGVNLNDFKKEIKQGDEFEVRGMRFRVYDKREDGQGGATLLLHKVKANERIPDTKSR